VVAKDTLWNFNQITLPLWFCSTHCDTKSIIHLVFRLFTLQDVLRWFLNQFYHQYIYDHNNRLVLFCWSYFTPYSCL